MSFNRLKYDNCSYKTDLTENISYLSYQMDPIRYENCNSCRPELGTRGGNAVSHIKGNLVDLENNLFGIDRPATRCPQQKWMPQAQLQGISSIRNQNYPIIDTTPVHLRPCQFFDTLMVPNVQPMNVSRCQRN